MLNDTNRYNEHQKPTSPVTIVQKCTPIQKSHQTCSLIFCIPHWSSCSLTADTNILLRNIINSTGIIILHGKVTPGVTAGGWVGSRTGTDEIAKKNIPPLPRPGTEPWSSSSQPRVHIFSKHVLCLFAYPTGLYIHLLLLQTYCCTANETKYIMH